MKRRLYSLMFPFLLLPLIATPRPGSAESRLTLRPSGTTQLPSTRSMNSGVSSSSVHFSRGRLSVYVHHAPLQSVLEAIAQQAEFTVTVSPSFATIPVTVDLSQVELEAGLQDILRQAGISNVAWAYRKKPRTSGNQEEWQIARLTIVAKGHGSPLLVLPRSPEETKQSKKEETKPPSPSKRLSSEQFRDPKTNQMIDVAAHEVMVRFDPKMSPDEIQKKVKRLNAEVIEAISQFGLYHLAISANDTVSSFIDKHHKDPRLRILEPNPIVAVEPVSNAPNDPLFRTQWALERIGALQAWEYLPQHVGGVIAVVDSGVDEHHPDLKEHIVQGKNLIDGSENISDPHGHGTVIAGIIAANINNEIGISGVCPKCQILPVKVLDEDGQGTYAQVIAGILWAADQKAGVINLSLGSYGYSRFLAEAIDYATQSGAVLVAAAGNESSQTPLYPGALPNVISVSASDRTDNLWSGSNYGPAIDLIAPGVEIVSTSSDNGYLIASGSSFSAAHVSGIAALVRTKHPLLKNSQVAQVLFETADDLGEKGKDDFYGFGRINAARALRAEIH